MLAADIKRGYPVSFDHIGSTFCNSPSPPGTRGPELRAGPLSLLDELSSQDLEHYTPSEVVTFLKQRKHVGCLSFSA